MFFYTPEQLVSGDTDASVDVYERSGGTTTQVSQGEINGDGAFEARFSGAPSYGSKVLFRTNEPLVSGDTDSSSDIYERSGGTTTQVSQGEINGNGAFDASFVGASSDGSRIFFQTNEQLVSGDTDASFDIYERSGGTTTQVSQGEINGNGAFDVTLAAPGPTGASVSSDGSRVFFETTEQLVGGDTDNSRDLYERSGGTTTQVSQGEINGDGAFEARFSGAPSDGSKVLFRTNEQLVSGDTDSSEDIYERSGGTTTQVSQGQVNGNGPVPAALVGTSSDGSRIFFHTNEPLVSGDTDSSSDIYERSGGTTSQISQGEINGNGAFDVSVASASSDGSRVFFYTYEPLVSADTNTSYDVYERSGGTTRLVAVEAIAPETTIDSGPSGTTNDPTPTLAFSSSEPGSSFECKLDSGAYAACSSPQTTSHLADGPHTFYVRATDPVENTDPTPATRSFTVKTAAISVSGSTLMVTAATGAKDNLRITRPNASTLRVSDLAAGAYTGLRRPHRRGMHAKRRQDGQLQRRGDHSDQGHGSRPDRQGGQLDRPQELNQRWGSERRSDRRFGKGHPDRGSGSRCVQRDERKRSASGSGPSLRHDDQLRRRVRRQGRPRPAPQGPELRGRRLRDQDAALSEACRRPEWARLVSNQRPLACEATILRSSETASTRGMRRYLPR